MALTQIGVVGSGMIMEDQNGPAIAQLVRRGILGQVHIAAQGSASLRRLLGLPWWRERFPDLPEGWVKTYPPLETDERVRGSDFYREMYRALPSGSIVMIAVPDSGHERLILEAAPRPGFHVLTVKSLMYQLRGHSKNLRSRAGKRAVRRHRFSQAMGLSRVDRTHALEARILRHTSGGPCHNDRSGRLYPCRKPVREALRP